MKKIVFLLTMAVGFLSFTPQNDTEAIVQAFRSGNAADVAKYFDSFVDIKLLDKEEVKNISKSQAGIMLKTFYSENGIKGFERGSERVLSNTMYMTGKLTGASKSYGITVLLKVKDGSHYITSIRIS